MLKKWGWMVCCVMILGVAVGGCSEDENNPASPPDPWVDPVSPDDLMSALVRVYEEMDDTNFHQLLHDNVHFYILPSTMAEWSSSGSPLAYNYFDKTALNVIHDKVFSGTQGLDPVGSTVAPVASIQFDYLEKVGGWEPYTDSGSLFGGVGGYSALFNVQLYFNTVNQFRFAVQSTVVIYVTPVDFEGEEVWQLLGLQSMEPMVHRKSSESTSWCQVLCLYR